MTTKLHIASDLALTPDYVTKTVGILAQRRKGKTYTANVIAEEFVAAGLPFVALDPTGAWWGLRASADAAGPGLSVTILGGQHGDISLDRTDGKGTAELVVDEPGWYVIDFSLFESNAAEVQFATEFAQRLYRRKGQPNSDFPMHLFVDEADRFVPQNPRSEKGEGSVTTMLGAFEAIVRRGGLRGLGTTLISQRSAVVNKNVLEQCDVMIVLRTVGPNDQKRIMEIVSAEGTPEQIAEIKTSMASLDLGEAWFWEPGEGIFQRVHIRERRTFNSSATPKPGEKRVEPRRLASVDLEAIKERWAEQIEKAKADDPKELRKQIAALKLALKATEDVAPEREIVERTIEVPVVPEVIIATLEQHRSALQAMTDGMADLIDACFDSGKLVLDAAPPAQAVAVPSKPAVRPAPAPRTPRSDVGSDGSLGKAERAFLTVLAQYPAGRTRDQVAIFAGYSVKSRHIDNTLAALRSAAYIEGGRDHIQITDAGLAALGEWEPLPTGPALIAHFKSRFLAKAASDFLDVVLGVHPATITRDEIAERAGYSVQSRHVDNTLAQLRSLQLIAGGRDAIHLNDEFAEAIGV